MMDDLRNVISQPNGVGILMVTLAIGFLIGIIFMRI